MSEQSPQKYEFIDTLRGFAILAVILFHTAQIVQPADGFFKQVAANGFMGVQLFFLTSALTLCLSLASRKRNEQSPTRNFFIRRFFRIAPMFYLALVFYLLLNGTGPRYWTPSGLRWYHPLLTLLFLHGWHPETVNSVVPGGWSIAVEMSFYVLLPILFLLLRDVKSTILFILGALVIGWDLNQVATRIYSPLYPDSMQYLVSSLTYFWLPSQLPIFGLGILVFQLFQRYRNLDDRFLGVILLLTACFVMGAFSQVETYNGLLPQHFLMGVGFAFLALGLYFSRLRLLVNPLTVLIGQISFSMYLVHFAFLKLLGATFPQGMPLPGTVGTLVAYFLVAGATILVSYLTYHFIERPGMRLGSVLIKRLEYGRQSAQVSAD